MEAGVQRRVQRYGWDRAVDHYERLWSSQLKPAQDRLIELTRLERGARVLEISCGTGLVTWPLAELVGPHGQVVATDISERMVERTAAEAARRGLHQVVCRRLGAEAIDEADATLTAAVAKQVSAFALASGGKDAAFVKTLSPGIYTLVGSAADGVATGIVLVEVYVVP